MDRPLARVSFYGHKITFEKLGDVVESKNISISALSQAFAQNAAFDTGILPTNHGVVRYVEKNNKITMFVQLPARKRNIRYRDESCSADYTNLPMPDCLFTFTYQRASDGKFSKIGEYVFALRQPLLSSNDNLYRLPFTNVYPDGEICWGGHTNVTSYTNLAGVSSIPEQFFASPFNNHLDDHRFNPTNFDIAGQNVRVSTVSTLLNALQTQEVFPNQVLIKQDTFEHWSDVIISSM